MDKPGMANLMIAPLILLERTKGWKRRALTFLYLLIVLLLGAYGWHSLCLWRLPNSPEPFDLAKYGRVEVADADNAMVAYNGLLGSLHLEAGSRFLFPSGFGTLGYALPAAIGAKLARPDRRVVAVHGDGGIMFTLPELASAAELGLPLPVVVSLNGGYGEIRREMVDQGIAPVAVDLGAPNLPAAARALGGHGEALTGTDQLVDALEAAFQRPGPTVITVPEA